MKYEKQVIVEVNGKKLTATVTLSLPGVEVTDHVDASMVLAAVAAGQNRTYVSRHQSDRTVRCLVNPVIETAVRKPALRLVA